jgi:hypothetical protein
MSYLDEYNRAALELKAALEELHSAERRAVALQRRMAALHVIIAQDNPEWERAQPGLDLDFSLKVMHATSRPADQLRRIFARSEGPLTVKELLSELRPTCDLSQQANPAGTVGALCARLIEQGVIRRIKKGGRIAWETI